MPATGFPGGLESPSIGTRRPLSGKVLYVGEQSLASAYGKRPLFSTLNAALGKCVANRGDEVRVLPGHIVSVTTADQMSNLPAGVTIVGIGEGEQRPIIRFSAAAATFLLDQAGTVIKNFRIQLAGDPAATTALTVAAPFTVSANGCAITDCDIDAGVDADQIITVGITVTGKRFEFARNRVVGAVAAEITAAGTVLRLTGADQAYIHDNYISAALATDTDGLIETLTTLSADIRIVDNEFYASGAGNTCALDFGAALVNTGVLRRNLCVVDADATAGTVVITQHATSNLALLDNFLVNDNGERGLVIGTASV